jgi:hypothetical protein
VLKNPLASGFYEKVKASSKSGSKIYGVSESTGITVCTRMGVEDADTILKDFASKRGPRTHVSDVILACKDAHDAQKKLEGKLCTPSESWVFSGFKVKSKLLGDIHLQKAIIAAATKMSTEVGLGSIPEMIELQAMLFPAFAIHTARVAVSRSDSFPMNIQNSMQVLAQTDFPGDSECMQAVRRMRSSLWLIFTQQMLLCRALDIAGAMS